MAKILKSEAKVTKGDKAKAAAALLAQEAAEEKAAAKKATVQTGKGESPATLAANNFAIRDRQKKIKLMLAKLTGSKLDLAGLPMFDGDSGEEVAGAKSHTVKIDAIVSAAEEQPKYDVLNGLLCGRTQVMHSLLIDAAKRNVVLTTNAMQQALESYLGSGHGAAYAHLNTLLGKGDNPAHPCKLTPFVVHDETVSHGWGLTEVACWLAGIAKSDCPTWVKFDKTGPYAKQGKPQTVKTMPIVPKKK